MDKGNWFSVEFAKHSSVDDFFRGHRQPMLVGNGLAVMCKRGYMDSDGKFRQVRRHNLVVPEYVAGKERGKYLENKHWFDAWIEKLTADVLGEVWPAVKGVFGRGDWGSRLDRRDSIG
jgi:hypothetical protein